MASQPKQKNLAGSNNIAKSKNLARRRRKASLIFDEFFRLNPDPKGELDYSDNFSLLVAVVLSAQATDVSVNKVTPELFALGRTASELAKLDVSLIEDKIKSIGLYRSKAKNLVKLSQQLIEHHDGVVPDNMSDLVALAGVGRKTANVVLNIAFGQPTIAVDTHLFRVSNRTGLANGKTPLEVEKSLLAVVPNKYLTNCHHWLILHGRYCCKARSPLCSSCKINTFCDYYRDRPSE